MDHLCIVCKRCLADLVPWVEFSESYVLGNGMGEREGGGERLQVLFVDLVLLDALTFSPHDLGASYRVCVLTAKAGYLGFVCLSS